MNAFWDNLAWILMVVFIFGGSLIWGVVKTLAKNWRQMKESEQLTLLKQSMIERGMSVEEMERVLSVGKPHKAEAEETPDKAEEQFRAG